MTEPLYSGEALLRNWSETANGKRRIVLEIEDNGGAHPFKGYEGERFAVVVMGPLASAEHEVSRKGKAGAVADGSSATLAPTDTVKAPANNSTRAVMLAKEPEFWAYMDHCGIAKPTDAASGEAALKFVCQVQSKRELNERGKAAEAFDRLLGNFKAWQQAKGHGAIA